MSIQFQTLDEIFWEEYYGNAPIDVCYRGVFETLEDAKAASMSPVSYVQRITKTDQFYEIRTVARKDHGGWKDR